MAENEKRQNVSTLRLYKEAGPLMLDDILYIVQGYGKDRDRQLSIQRLLDYITISSSAVVSVTSAEQTIDLSKYSAGNNVLISITGNAETHYVNITGYGNINIGILRTLKGEPASVTIGDNTYNVPAKGLLVFTKFGSATVINDASKASFDELHAAKFYAQAVNILTNAGQNVLNDDGLYIGKNVKIERDKVYVSIGDSIVGIFGDKITLNGINGGITLRKDGISGISKFTAKDSGAKFEGNYSFDGNVDFSDGKLNAGRFVDKGAVIQDAGSVHLYNDRTNELGLVITVVNTSNTTALTVYTNNGNSAKTVTVGPQAAKRFICASVSNYVVYYPIS